MTIVSGMRRSCPSRVGPSAAPRQPAEPTESHGDQPLANGRHTLSARVIDAKNRIRDARVAINIAGCKT